MGFFVSMGWVFNSTFLKSISENWVTMKPVEAALLMITSFLIFFIKKTKINQNKRQIGISFLTFAIFAIIFGLCSDSLESLINGQYQPPIMSVKPLFPSYCTVLCFFIVAVRGLIYLFTTNIKWLVKLFGMFIGFCGISSFLGYLIKEPGLYFMFNKKFTGVAFLSAIAMILIGFMFYRNDEESLEENDKSDQNPQVNKVF